MLYVIPDKTIDLEKRHYNSVYVLLHFKKGKGFYDREEYTDMKADLHEQDMEDARLDNEREYQRKMVFKDNSGGMDDEKVIINSKRRDVYMNEKNN